MIKVTTFFTNILHIYLYSLLNFLSDRHCNDGDSASLHEITIITQFTYVVFSMEIQPTLQGYSLFV